MSIKNNFNLSFGQMWDNKIVALPYFVTAVLTFILLMAFILSSGFYPVLQHSSAVETQYASGAITAEEYEFEQTTLNSMMTNLLTVKNTVMFLVFLIAIIVVSVYGQCVSLVMTANVAKGKSADLKLSLGEACSYFFKFMLYQICFILLIAVPIVLLFLLSGVAGIINSTLGTITLIICVAAMIAYVIYFATKLIFGAPILFLEDSKAVDSMKKSYKITTGRFNEAFLVGLVAALIILAFTILGNNFGFDPTTGGMLSGAAILGWILMLIFYIVNSFVNALVQLFLMNSYTDFKAPVTAEKKTAPVKQVKPKKKLKRK